MRQLCILEKLNLKMSRESMLPEPSSLVDSSLAGPTLNCFRRSSNDRKLGKIKGNVTSESCIFGWAEYLELYFILIRLLTVLEYILRN